MWWWKLRIFLHIFRHILTLRWSCENFIPVFASFTRHVGLNGRKTCQTFTVCVNERKIQYEADEGWKAKAKNTRNLCVRGRRRRRIFQKGKREEKTKTNLSRVDGICRHFLLAHRVEKYSNRLNSWFAYSEKLPERRKKGPNHQSCRCSAMRNLSNFKSLGL